MIETVGFYIVEGDTGVEFVMALGAEAPETNVFAQPIYSPHHIPVYFDMFTLTCQKNFGMNLADENGEPLIFYVSYDGLHGLHGGLTTGEDMPEEMMAQMVCESLQILATCVAYTREVALSMIEFSSDAGAVS